MSPNTSTARALRAASRCRSSSNNARDESAASNSSSSMPASAPRLLRSSDRIANLAATQQDEQGLPAIPATSDGKASAKRSETGLRKKDKQGGTPAGASAKKVDAPVSTPGTAGGLRSSIRRSGNVATSASATKTDVEETAASFDGTPAAPSTGSSKRGRKKKNEEKKGGTETLAAASAATQDVGSAQSLRSSSRIAGLASLSSAADDPATPTAVAAADADVDATLTNKALRTRRQAADAAASSSSSPFTPVSTGKESNKKKRRALPSATKTATTSNKKSKRNGDCDGAEDDHNDEEDALPTATAGAPRTTRSRAAAANLTTATTPRLAPSTGNLTISDAQQKHKKTKKKNKTLMSSSAAEEFPLASTPTGNTPTSTSSGQKKGKGPAMAADAGSSSANSTDASPASDIDSGTTDHVRHAHHTPGAPESWPPAMYRHNDLHKWIIISEAPDFASVRTTYGADEKWPVLPRRERFMDPFGKRELVGGVSSLRSMVECAVQRKDRLVGVVEGLERESVEGRETDEAVEQEREGAGAGDKSQEKRGYWDVVLRRTSVGDVGKADGPVGREVAIAAARQEEVVVTEASGESDSSGFKSPDAVERVENPGQDPNEGDTRPDSEDEESEEESSILLGTFGGVTYKFKNVAQRNSALETFRAVKKIYGTSTKDAHAVTQQQYGLKLADKDRSNRSSSSSSSSGSEGGSNDVTSNTSGSDVKIRDSFGGVSTVTFGSDDAAPSPRSGTQFPPSDSGGAVLPAFNRSAESLQARAETQPANAAAQLHGEQEAAVATTATAAAMTMTALPTAMVNLAPPRSPYNSIGITNAPASSSKLRYSENVSDLSTENSEDDRESGLTDPFVDPAEKVEADGEPAYYGGASASGSGSGAGAGAGAGAGVTARLTFPSMADLKKQWQLRPLKKMSVTQLRNEIMRLCAVRERLMAEGERLSERVDILEEAKKKTEMGKGKEKAADRQFHAAVGSEGAQQVEAEKESEDVDMDGAEKQLRREIMASNGYKEYGRSENLDEELMRLADGAARGEGVGGEEGRMDVD